MSASIVCGIDASAQAQSALRVASSLSERLKLRLVVLHAVLPRPDFLFEPGHRDPLGLDYGERVLNDAEVNGASDVKRRLESGRATQWISAVAREEQAQFVVVGSRGAGAGYGDILGKVSSAIIRDAPCPTVVVPPRLKDPEAGGERVVCGVHVEADGPAISVGLDLARRLGVPMSVALFLSAETDHTLSDSAIALVATYNDRLPHERNATQTMHRLLEQADESSCEHRIDLPPGDASGQLLRLAASTRAMLLVVSNGHPTPAWPAAPLSPHARELLRDASLPVVICPHRGEP